MRNPVLETNLGRLARYGYGQSAPCIERAAEWARLKSDFTDARGPTVPDFDELPSSAKAAAERYLALKAEANDLLSACEAAHAEILNQGLDVARVEDYAVIRDSYEDKVEEFGAARAALAELLK